MELRVLAVGDVVGEGGLQCLEQHLRSLKKLYRIDFCVVNGENASGTGLTPKQADRMLDAGADILTLGNHSFDRREICAYLDTLQRCGLLTSERCERWTYYRRNEETIQEFADFIANKL